MIRRGPFALPFEFTDEHHREMWAHIARHGLVVETYKSHFEELSNALNLDALGARAKAVAVGLLRRSLKDKTRSLKDQKILICTRGDGGKALGVYPYWVQAWARPGWNGDITVPAVEIPQATDRDDGKVLPHGHSTVTDNESWSSVSGGKVDPVVMKARHEVMRRVDAEVRGIHVGRNRLSDRFEDAFSRQRATPRSLKYVAKSRRASRKQAFESGTAGDETDKYKAAEQQVADRRLAGQIVAGQIVAEQGVDYERAAQLRTADQSDIDKRGFNQQVRRSPRTPGYRRLEIAAEQAETDVWLAEAEVIRRQEELQDITHKVSKWKEIDDLSRKIVAANQERDRLDDQIMRAKVALSPFPNVPAQRLAKEGLGHVFTRDWLTTNPTSSKFNSDEPRLGLATLMRETANKMEASCQAKAEQFAQQVRIDQRKSRADDFARRQAVAARPRRARKCYANDGSEGDYGSVSNERMQQYRLKRSGYSQGCSSVGQHPPEQKLEHKSRGVKPDSRLESLDGIPPQTLDSLFGSEAMSGSQQNFSPNVGQSSQSARPEVRHHSQVSMSTAFHSSPTPTLPQAPRPSFSQPHRQSPPPIPPPMIFEEPDRSPGPRPLSLYDVEQTNTRFYAHLRNRISQLGGIPSAVRDRESEIFSQSLAAADVARQQLFTILRRNASRGSIQPTASGQNGLGIESRQSGQHFKSGQWR